MRLTADVALAVHASSHLSDSLRIALDKKDDVQEELEALEHVDSNSSPVSIYAKAEIAVVAHWVAGRIKSDEHFPKLHGGVISHNTEDGEQGHARTVTHLL